MYQNLDLHQHWEPLRQGSELKSSNLFAGSCHNKERTRLQSLLEQLFLQLLKFCMRHMCEAVAMNMVESYCEISITCKYLVETEQQNNVGPWPPATAPTSTRADGYRNKMPHIYPSGDILTHAFCIERPSRRSHGWPQSVHERDHAKIWCIANFNIPKCAIKIWLL